MFTGSLKKTHGVFLAVSLFAALPAASQAGTLSVAPTAAPYAAADVGFLSYVAEPSRSSQARVSTSDVLDSLVLTDTQGITLGGSARGRCVVIDTTTVRCSLSGLALAWFEAALTPENDLYSAEGAGIRNIVHGGGGNDEIIGSQAKDALYGDDGGDKLLGLDRDDLLAGGNGSATDPGSDLGDVLVGGSGRDGLFGEAGNDTLVGDEGEDYLFGGTGVDGIFAHDGERDTIECVSGGDGDYIEADAVDWQFGCGREVDSSEERAAVESVKAAPKPDSLDITEVEMLPSGKPKSKKARSVRARCTVDKKRSAKKKKIKSKPGQLLISKKSKRKILVTSPKKRCVSAKR